MNYAKSKEILEKIRKADRILLNCHRSPDPDAIGSALALYKVLLGMGKEVEIICPTKINWNSLGFLKNYKKIKQVDFSKFDFSAFELFIVLDSSSWNQISDSRDFTPPRISVIVIDHHKTSENFGEINLVDEKKTSTAELLYLILLDWGVTMDKDIATALLAGIIGDTGTFSYAGVGKETLERAGKLMEIGADKDKIVEQIYRSLDFATVKFWGEVIANAKIDSINKFLWSAIPYPRFVELGSLTGGRESAAGLIAQEVKGTDFGMIMVEQQPKKLSVSFRSRTGIDVSLFAKKLGGGGHLYASGAKVEGLSFDDAVARVLMVVRESLDEAKKR